MQKTWRIASPAPDLVHRLSGSLACPPVIARLLVNRRITEPEAARRFLRPQLTDLTAPFDLADMRRATDRLVRAIRHRERILIFGDYDLDGISATALLVAFLKETGADVTTYTPHRLKEGYGLQPAQVGRIARRQKPDIIVTADCGSASREAIDAARTIGIDVIVTDHHRMDGDLPPALAVINPHRSDCSAGLTHLAGVGVAFYLVIALRKALRDADFWQGRPEPVLRNYCDLVALGTVADMVPLTAENRILTQVGLDVLESGRRVGVAALLTASGVSSRKLDAEDIAFRLAPRLNAAGRMAHAQLGVHLMGETDPKRARRLAQLLERLNRRRREVEERTVRQAESFLARHPEHLNLGALVLADSRWHEGVIGIAASRLVRRYRRPVVMVAIKNGVGKGSARSVPGFDIYRGLSECRSLLSGFGGHAAAAGLQLSPENIDSLQSRLNELVSRTAGVAAGEDRLDIDAEVNIAHIRPDLIDAVEALGPFGSGNAEPVFAARGVRVADRRVVGNGHLKMLLEADAADGPRRIDGIWFHPAADAPGGEVRRGRLAYRLRWNRWNDRRRPQLVVVDFLPESD